MLQRCFFTSVLCYNKEVVNQVNTITKKDTIINICLSFKGYFTLKDVYNAVTTGAYNISAPYTRYCTQIARDKGYITFIDNNGTYYIN